MPPLVSELQARQEMVTAFPALAGHGMRDDFARMGSFLTDAAAVADALLPLERAMVQAISNKMKPRFAILWDLPHEAASAAAADYYQKRGQLFAGNASAQALAAQKQGIYEHILSDLLTADEAGRGYVHHQEGTKGLFDYLFGTRRSRAQTVTRGLTGEEFRAMLTQQRHWKDPTVSARHGEYTHRLHWYAAAHAPGVLTSPAGDVFAAVGAIKRPRRDVVDEMDVLRRPYLDNEMEAPAYEKLEREFKVIHWGLWDALFDRDSGGAPVVPFRTLNTTTDFRAAEVFNDWLTGVNDVATLQTRRARLPVLTAFLTARRQKRDAGGFMYDGQAYVSNMFYKRPYNQLSAGERRVVDDAVERGIHRK